MKRRNFLLAATVFSPVLLAVALVFLTNSDERAENDSTPTVFREHVPMVASGLNKNSADVEDAESTLAQRMLEEEDAASVATLPLTSSSAVQAPVLRILFEETTQPDSEGHFQRKRVIETEMHYPLIRIVEKMRQDAQSGEKVLLDRKSMVADHVVLQLTDAVSEAEVQALAAKHGVGIRRQLGQDGLYLAEFAVDGVDSLLDAVARMSVDGSAVRYVEPDYIVTPMATPNDPRFFDGSLWGLHNTGQRDGRPGADIGAVPTWENVRTDAGSVIVAVIDTGIRHTHRDLAANMWRNPRETANRRDDSGSGYIDDIHGVNVITGTGDPMDDHGHGTHVAGTIGAVGNNGEGITGVAWNVQLMGVKFLGRSGGTTSDAILAVDYARENGAQVLNNSWGGGGYSQALFEAIQRTRDAGLIFVAAAGNDGSNNDLNRSYPSGYDLDNIVTVGSMNRHGELSNFSNYGTQRVDIMAPGGTSLFSDPPGDAILSTHHTSDTAYTSMSGTSMAAPHVAGMFALVKAEFPNDSASRLINRVLSAAIEVPGLADRLSFGRRANLFRSFGLGGLPITLQPLQDAEFQAGDEHTFTVEAMGEKPMTYTWYKDGSEINGAVGSSLTLGALSPLDTGVYRVVIENPVGTTSSEGTLSYVLDAPEIGNSLGASELVWTTTPDKPWDLAGENGVRSSTVTGHNGESKLQTTVAGPGELTFWWKVSSEQNYDFLRFSLQVESKMAISGEIGWQKKTVSIPEGTHTLVWSYEKDGSVSNGSDAGWLADVVYNQFSPRITEHPESVELEVGDSYVLSAQASGADSLQWHWRRDGALISGANTSDFLLDTVTLDDAGTYRAGVSNSHGAVVSLPAVVTVVEEARAPAITRDPASATVLEGDRVVFSTGFSGTWPFSVQWFKNGVPLEGGEGAELVIEDVSSQDAGLYTATVSNRAGSVETEGALLTTHPRQLSFDDWISQKDLPSESRGWFDSPADDNIPNLLKYAFGLDPLEWQPSPAPAAVLIDGSPAVLMSGEGSSGTETFGALIFDRASNTVGLTFTLEASTDLAAWQGVPAELSVIQALDPITERVKLQETDPVGTADRRFFRLRIGMEQ